MTTYRYVTKLIAVRAVEYSDAASIGLQNGLTGLLEGSVRFKRGESVIHIDQWIGHHDGHVSSPTHAAPDPLLDFIKDESEQRAREIEWRHGGDWVPLSIYSDGTSNVQAPMDSFYCIPPVPARYYPTFVLHQGGAPVTIRDADGDRLGDLALMLDLAPAADWQ